MDGEAIIAILLGAALAIFSLVIAGYPIVRDAFFRPAARAEDSDDASLPPDAAVAGVGAESIYDAIETLELDYQLGNLPEAEYRRQLQAYRVEAAEVIRAQLERGPDAGPDTEDAADAAGPESRLEREVMAWRGADAPEILPSSDTSAACPECDAPIPAGLRGPCPGCGAARR